MMAPKAGGPGQNAEGRRFLDASATRMPCALASQALPHRPYLRPYLKPYPTGLTSSLTSHYPYLSPYLRLSLILPYLILLSS